MRITIRSNNTIKLAHLAMTDTQDWYLFLLLDQENQTKSFCQVNTLSAEHNLFLLAPKASLGLYSELKGESMILKNDC